MPLTIPPINSASQISFSSQVGLTSTNVNNGIDEVYYNAVKLAGTETITGAKTFSAVTNFSSNTAANSASTGGVVITGGLGVGGAIYSTTLRVTGGANSSNTTTGAAVITGGFATGGNAYIGGNLVGTNLPKLFAYRSTNTSSINQAVTTQLIFDAEEKDNQNIHNTSTGIITIPSGYAGSYALKIYLIGTFTTDGTQANRLIINSYKNNVSYRELGGFNIPAGTSVSFRVSACIDLYDLAVNDTIDIRIAGFSNSGASFTINSGSWLSLHKIA